jgi:hypothetical protein
MEEMNNFIGRDRGGHTVARKQSLPCSLAVKSIREYLETEVKIQKEIKGRTTISKELSKEPKTSSNWYSWIKLKGTVSPV